MPFALILINATYRCEVVDILEVEHDWEAERCEVSDAGIVHEVLSSEEAWTPSHQHQIVEPEDAPHDLCQVEGIVVKALKGTVEVSLGLTINLDRDEVIIPKEKQTAIDKRGEFIKKKTLIHVFSFL